MRRTCKDEAVSEVDVMDDEWREECEKEIPNPVASGGECSLLRAGTCREGFTNENPDTWSPGARVAKNEQARRNDHQNADVGMSRWVNCSSNRSKDE